MKTRWMMMVLAALCGMARAEVFYSGVISGATSFADDESNSFNSIIFDITSTNYGIAFYDLANRGAYSQPAVGGVEVEFRIGDLAPLGYGAVVTTGADSYMGSLLAADAVIGPNSAFTGWAYIKGYGMPENDMPWNPQWWDESGVDVRGYAGLWLQSPEGVNNYGWVDISYSSSTAQWSVNGWAYETQAETAIGAGAVESIPEPATALLLALGGGLVWLARLKQRF